MLLTYGDCSKLKGTEWCMLEVRSEKTIEPTLRRIGKAIPFIFRDDALELFIPIGRRDLDTFDLEAAAYLFVRSTSFSGLLRLKTITGVVSLVTEGDSNRPSKVIRVQDSDVQALMRDAERRFREHSSGIGIGSFVRVLNGETRDFCGSVVAMGSGRAVVRIRLKTRSIMLETPLANLLNLSHVPPELRTYYHCPLVSGLREEPSVKAVCASIDKEIEEALSHGLTPEEHASLGEETGARKAEAARRAGHVAEALELVRGDTRLEEAPAPKRAAAPLKRSRQKTVTALVRKLILIDHIHVPMGVATRVVAAIRAGEVKPPKNYFIIYTIIKDCLMKYWVRGDSPGIKSYREAVKHYGDVYRFSARQISKVDPALQIPLGNKG
jgi:hypothetical protein